MICFATDERCIPDRAEYNPVAAANRRVGCPARYQSQQIIQAQHNANGGLDCAASPGRCSFLAAPAGQNHIGCQVCQSPRLQAAQHLDRAGTTGDSIELPAGLGIITAAYRVYMMGGRTLADLHVCGTPQYQSVSQP